MVANCTPGTSCGYDLRPDEQHIARCGDGSGEEEAYRTARALAEMVGIRLEG